MTHTRFFEGFWRLKVDDEIGVKLTTRLTRSQRSHFFPDWWAGSSSKWFKRNTDLFWCAQFVCLRFFLLFCAFCLSVFFSLFLYCSFCLYFISNLFFHLWSVDMLFAVFSNWFLKRRDSLIGVTLFNLNFILCYWSGVDFIKVES